MRERHERRLATSVPANAGPIGATAHRDAAVPSCLSVERLAAAMFAEVSFGLDRGQTLGLLAPEAGGARGLLSVLAGRVPALRGLACVDGAPVAGAGADAIRRDPAPRPDPRRVGLARGSDPLLPHLDVAGNVALPLRAIGAARTTRLARTAETLAMLGLDAVAADRVDRLPAAIASRVRIARALACAPSLLLLDDPGAGLAPPARAALLALLRRLCHARGQTTLLATDDAGEALAFGETAALWSDGRLWQLGTATELLDRPRHARVAAAFGAANLLAGQVIDADDAERRIRLACGACLDAMVAPETDPDLLPPGAACEIAIRPDRLAVAFVDRLPATPEAGTLPATLLDAQPMGERLRLRLRLPDGTELVAHRPAQAIRGRLERDRPALLACLPADATVFAVTAEVVDPSRGMR